MFRRATMTSEGTAGTAQTGSSETGIGPMLREESNLSTRYVSQWEQLMRRYSADVKCKFDNCKKVHLDWNCELRPPKKFLTGSVYDGTWDQFGMSGYGVYTHASGVVYEGEFEDGEFHGEGELRYPIGVKIRGRWNHGELKDKTIIFDDGVEFMEKDWQYCRWPDRRFTVEYEKGLKPAGKTYKTADQPTKEIPTGFYDVGDGFYDPKTKAVYNYDNMKEIIRCPDKQLQDWIVANCATTPELYAPVGAREDLYPEWPEPTLELEAEPPAPSMPQTEFSDDTNVTGRTGSVTFDNGVPWKKEYSEVNTWGRKPLITFEPETKSQTSKKDQK